MKKNTKIIISFLGVVVVVILVVWGLNSDASTPNYSNSNNNVDSPRPFKGNPEARVVLTEFSDFQCPACKSAATLVNSLAERYNEQIKIEYKHFPLTRIHTNAFNAALAAECANDQGKFWEMHDKIYENQENLKKKDLKLYASKIEGIDTTSFDACLDSRAKTDVVNKDIDEANSLKLNATPTFFLNGKEVENPNNLENLILEALQ